MLNILAEPPRLGTCRVCDRCRAWFALVKIAEREDAVTGSVTTYRCRKCGAETQFAERHPPGAV